MATFLLACLALWVDTSGQEREKSSTRGPLLQNLRCLMKKRVSTSRHNIWEEETKNNLRPPKRGPSNLYLAQELLTLGCIQARKWKL